jgi:hypothetical protein
MNSKKKKKYETQWLNHEMSNPLSAGQFGKLKQSSLIVRRFHRFLLFQGKWVKSVRIHNKKSKQKGNPL